VIKASKSLRAIKLCVPNPNPQQPSGAIGVWKTLAAFVPKQWDVQLKVRHCQRRFIVHGFRLRNSSALIAPANLALQSRVLWSASRKAGDAENRRGEPEASGAAAAKPFSMPATRRTPAVYILPRVCEQLASREFLY
jgi:hypothetical protein